MLCYGIPSLIYLSTFFINLFPCQVDERAVLKHFDWPEGKADALREAAFEYQDLMKLEKQVSTFEDNPKLSCEAALKKMYSLLEKYVISSLA